MAQRLDRQGAWVRAALERYEAALLRYAQRMTRDHDAAQDIVQEAFVRLWRADRSRIEGNERAWLYAVCRNQAIDAARKERRMRPWNRGLDGALTAVGNDPTDLAEMDERQRAVLRVLQHRPPLEQEVVRLRFVEGLSYREIGTVTGKSVSHVGVLIHTAIQAVRNELGVTPATVPARSRT